MTPLDRYAESVIAEIRKRPDGERWLAVPVYCAYALQRTVLDYRGH